MEAQKFHGDVLCADVLTLIAQRTKGMEDFCAFRLSSTLFKQAATLGDFHGLYLRRKVPYLMLPTKEDGMVEFFSLAKEKVVAKVTLPEAKGKRWIESQGWLLTFGGYQDKRISLLHPFEHLEIRLPNEMAFIDYGWIQTLPYEFIQKMVLSSRPFESSDFAVVVIYGACRELGLWKPGNQNWTKIFTKRNLKNVLDVTYFNRQFFAIDSEGQVWTFDGKDPNPIRARFVVSLPCEYGNPAYVVESSGMLLVVAWRPGKFCADGAGDEEFINLFGTETWEDTRYLGSKATYKPPGFDLFEVNPVTKSWKQIKDLVGKALFIGKSASLLIEATRGIKANHIYYAGTPWLHDGGAWIYSLEDGKLEPLDVGDSIFPMYPPVWIAPCF